MSTITRRVLVFVLCVAGAASAKADTIGGMTINPTDDGSLYVPDGPDPANVNTSGYLTLGGSIQGMVVFPGGTFPGPIEHALLSINPYAEPVFVADVEVYGIAKNGPMIDASDANAGTLLGTLHLPTNLGYGQDASFDVTTFLAATSSPYVGFNLRSNSGSGVFSSLEYNLGHPAQLHVTYAVLPEPTTGSLLVASLGLLALVRRMRKPKSAPQSGAAGRRC